MIREITSAANPLVKRLRSLATSKKAREESGAFLVEGWRGIDTLLRHRHAAYAIELLAVSGDWRTDPRLPAAVESVALPDFVFDRISDVRNAQGILAVVRRQPVPFAVRPEAGRYLLLDGVADPGNLGTLIRSAVGAEFDGVLLHGDCAEPFSPKVVRSAMGTFACCHLWNIGRAELDQLLQAGYELCATAGSGGENLYAARFPLKCVLAVGSEAHGLAGELMQRAVRRITIPLAGQCESLNAAVAGSICMFQMKNGRPG